MILLLQLSCLRWQHFSSEGLLRINPFLFYHQEVELDL